MVDWKIANQRRCDRERALNESYEANKLYCIECGKDYQKNFIDNKYHLCYNCLRNKFKETFPLYSFQNEIREFLIEVIPPYIRRKEIDLYRNSSIKLLLNKTFIINGYFDASEYDVDYILDNNDLISILKKQELSYLELLIYCAKNGIRPHNDNSIEFGYIKDERVSIYLEDDYTFIWDIQFYIDPIRGFLKAKEIKFKREKSIFYMSKEDEKYWYHRSLKHLRL